MGNVDPENCPSLGKSGPEGSSPCLSCAVVLHACHVETYSMGWASMNNTACAEDGATSPYASGGTSSFPCDLGRVAVFSSCGGIKMKAFSFDLPLLSVTRRIRVEFARQIGIELRGRKE